MSENEVKVNENEVKVNIERVNAMIPQWLSTLGVLEERVIALEHGLEAVLRRMEASTSPDDDPGWYGCE